MNLLTQSFSATKWTFWAVRMFMRHRPLTTLTIVVLSALSRVTNVLAFFLPLKVILLAASEGMPQSLGLLIGPADKMDWIILLSIAAVACYVSTLLFDAISDRLAESGSAGVLEGAKKLALAGKQRKQARATYYKLTNAVAGMAFGVVGMAALAVINTLLFGALVALFATEFGFTALMLAGWRAIYPGRLQNFIQNNLADYLNILSSVNFLVSFFLILAPFLFGREANVLLAVLAVVIIRRALPEMETAIRIVVDLYKSRHAVEPLIFRRRRFRVTESAESRLVRELFNKGARQALVEKYLSPLRPEWSDYEVCWQDLPARDIYTFIVSGKPASKPEREFLQLQAFPERHAHMLGNEDFLFSLVDRSELKAPHVATQFRISSFECQVCEYGRSGEPAPKQYRAALPDLLADIWSCVPPEILVAAFSTAHDMLPGRLTSDLVERIAVAADSADENVVIETLQRRLPEVRACLERLPLQVFNPDLNRAYVSEIGPGEFRVMTWIHWAIEPIGAGIPKELVRPALPALVERVNSRRKDLDRELSLHDVEFANMCWNYERLIERDQYKAALSAAAKILAYLP